jgi:hypothetical protein
MELESSISPIKDANNMLDLRVYSFQHLTKDIEIYLGKLRQVFKV